MSQPNVPLARACHAHLSLSFTLAAALLTGACQSPSSGTAPGAAAKTAAAVTADTWAVVDGRAIMRADVDKAYNRLRDPNAPPASDEEALLARINLLDNLIIQEILLGKAQAQKIEVPQADIDQAFNDAKKNIPDEAFQQELTKRGLTVADMRENLRRELLTQKVITQDVTSKVIVDDQEVTQFYNANRAQFNVAEEAYHLAQIAVTPVRDAQVANQTGDDATTPQAAAQKAQMLMEKLKAGASFGDLAAGYSEDPDSAPRGGDIGLVPLSRLMQAPPALRNAVLQKEPGTVSVANVNGAFTLVLVVSHEMPGQRDLSTPGVRDQIVNGLKGRREQLMRTAYLTTIRNDAQVVNYAAKRIVESKGQIPSLQIATPGAPAAGK